MTVKPFVLVLTGPTASGKTKLALELAVITPIDIINADSMQVYRGMDIGTAKPSLEEQQTVSHHLIDIRDPDQDFSVGDYISLFRRTVEDIISRGRLPVVVGGTGLYIRGALGGLFKGPSRDDELRERLLSTEADEPGVLYSRLKVCDEHTAEKTGEDDLVRIVRALEVLELTGKPISIHQQEHAFSDRPYESRMFCLNPPREMLYVWIEERVDRMFSEGFLEEVESLKKNGYGAGLNAMKALGYRELMAYKEGKYSLPETIELIKRNTRRFAKRQITWFRGEKDVEWMDLKSQDQLSEIARDIAADL